MGPFVVLITVTGFCGQENSKNLYWSYGHNGVRDGHLNITIGMAVVRPAEFIILAFSHKLTSP